MNGQDTNITIDPDPKTIAFTGNCFGLSDDQKKEIIKIFDTCPNITVFHGDCVGADTDFHNLCLEYRTKQNKQIQIHIYLPDNDKLRGFNKGDIYMNPQPYLTRNKNMVKKCDILIGCPIDKNKEQLRSGTWATIRYANKIKKQIYLL